MQVLTPSGRQYRANLLLPKSVCHAYPARIVTVHVFDGGVCTIRDAVFVQYLSVVGDAS